MKVFTSSLLLAAITVALVRADSCDTASVTALLTSSDVTTCTEDSGYSPASLITPTDPEMKLLCTSTSCQSVLSTLTKMFTEECTVGTFALYADLITPVSNFCSGSTSSAASVATSSPASGSSDVSTTASAASTAASAASNAASAASTAASAGSEAVASSASLNSAEEVTVAPTTNSTSSASSDDDVNVGDSESGSDLDIETPTPATDSESASTTTDSTTSASSPEDDRSSGSSAGVAVNTPSIALLGSAILAAAAVLV